MSNKMNGGQRKKKEAPGDDKTSDNDIQTSENGNNSVKTHKLLKFYTCQSIAL